MFCCTRGFDSIVTPVFGVTTILEGILDEMTGWTMSRNNEIRCNAVRVCSAIDACVYQEEKRKTGMKKHDTGIDIFLLLTRMRWDTVYRMLTGYRDLTVGNHCVDPTQTFACVTAGKTEPFKH